eukprot:327780-Pelagomonas_calceolata.AAC.5
MPSTTKLQNKRVTMGIWRVFESSWLQNLTVRNTFALNSMPSGNKPVGIRNRVGMKFASNFDGTLVVKTQLFKLVKDMLSVTGPTNIQEDGM